MLLFYLPTVLKRYCSLTHTEKIFCSGLNFFRVSYEAHTIVVYCSHSDQSKLSGAPHQAHAVQFLFSQIFLQLC